MERESQRYTAHLVGRQGSTLVFEDSARQRFEGEALEVVIPVGCTLEQARRRLTVATLLSVKEKKRTAAVLGVPRRSLYRNIQENRIPGDAEALLKLGAELGVRDIGDELDIEARQLVRLRQGLGLPADEGARANCWLAPGFDAIQMVMDLEREVRGRGGRIPQECLYAEPLSAKRWLDYEQDPAYLHIYRDLPLDRAAQAIVAHAGSPLAVLSLGPGGGVREVQLVQHLLRLGPEVRRLYLLDLSHPLLARAVTHAEATLPQVRVTGIWGNMYHLPRYDAMLPYEDRAVVRLVTMLGGTFGNLRNEIEFARDALGPLAPGDLLLFDACLRPQTDDPRLTRPLPPAFLDWITTPLRQHGGVEVLEVRGERTEETTVVRNSYAVDFVAHMRGGAEFRLGTLRRYDEGQLLASLGRVGWHHRTSLVFGGDYPRALMLFQKGEVLP